MSKIFLIRHGQSYWNLENKFTGSIDIGLTDLGRKEALRVAKDLQPLDIQLAFASDLIRAQETAMIALSLQAKACQRTTGKIEKDTLPIIIDARLNERSYGDLQGMDKNTARQKFGSEQVHKWRRGFAERPPAGESLADTVARVNNFITEQLLSALNQYDNIAIFAHGNSIRAIHMLFTSTSENDITKFEVATGQLLSYEFVNNKFSEVYL